MKNILMVLLLIGSFSAMASITTSLIEERSFFGDTADAIKELTESSVDCLVAHPQFVVGESSTVYISTNIRCDDFSDVIFQIEYHGFDDSDMEILKKRIILAFYDNEFHSTLLPEELKGYLRFIRFKSRFGNDK